MAKYQSRLDKRSKKNTNKLLNIMIAIVLLLIVVVGGTIVLGGGGGEKATTDAPKNSETKDANNSDKGKEKDNSVSMDEKDDSKDKADDEQKDEDKKKEDKKKEDEKKKDESSDENQDSVALDGEDQSKMKVEESTEPNVVKTMVHPDWKPIGTEQTGEHVSVYDEGTVDWQEKIKATSYATGIPEENMTIWWMEGNGGPQKSMATVTTKDTKTPYRVYLQWVDGKGWQPTKVQELKENDKD
ncbi:YrrS family protein [Rossellomorea vietnamensis]|uniref:YrrS family protein n=1 Tax=Rossellomorea vietnamensis TaxID=218284 RepID=UPI003D27E4AD